MKNQNVMIRVTETDKELIKKRAEENGLSISEYMMRLVLLDAERNKNK